jgi:hypothetical protein
MLSEQELESLLSRSPAAREFFRQAHQGLLDDRLYNDLFYSPQLNQIFARALKEEPRLLQGEQLVLRMDPGSSIIWRNLDWGTFVVFAIQEYVHTQQIEEYRRRFHASDRQDDRGLELKRGLHLGI